MQYHANLCNWLQIDGAFLHKNADAVIKTRKGFRKTLRLQPSVRYNSFINSPRCVFCIYLIKQENITRITSN